MKKTHWSELPDEKLVFAAILGELRAFDELVLRYRPAVVRTALGIVKSKETAEDVAQEALLLAFKALPDLNDMSRFPAWLYAITRHRALRYQEQYKKRQERHLPLDEMILRHSPALRAPPPDEPDDIKAEVRAAVECLPEDYGTVIKLHYYDEMPLKRIADFLDIPLSTVKWRLYKARKLIKGHMKVARK